MELFSKMNKTVSSTCTPPPLTKTLFAAATPLAKHLVKFDELTSASPASKKETPPPTLYVFDDDAAQAVETSDSEMKQENKIIDAVGTRTNNAPPAALALPGRHDSDCVDNNVLLNWQLKKNTLEDSTSTRGGGSDCVTTEG
jgi:hypothetical protein